MTTGLDLEGAETPKLAPPAPDDVTVDRGVWTPTFNQMEAYRAREVEMCVATIKRFEYGSVPGGALRQDQTLFSFKTWEAAHATLKHVKELEPKVA